MNFPADILYTPSHEWAKIEGDVLTMGLSDYAQSELGDIVFVEMPATGKKADAGKSIGSIEAVKTVSDIYAPMTGEVIAVNDKLKDSPQLINTDPYGEGWILKIKISDMSKKADLLNADQYQATTAH
jgi:glycine cleavage system H protein